MTIMLTAMLPLVLESDLLKVNPGLIFWTTITFILLIIVLSKTAWKPILSALNEREKNIQSSIDRAETARTDAEKLLAESKKALSQTQVDADKIIQEAKSYAEKMRVDLVEKAGMEARKTIEDAKKSIENEKQRALAELRDEVVSLAIRGAEMIIKHNLDAEKQKNIIVSVINDMPTLTPELIK
jgi:F-type H+-transporting ATPase subunit b